MPVEPRVGARVKGEKWCSRGRDYTAIRVIQWVHVTAQRYGGILPIEELFVTQKRRLDPIDTGEPIAGARIEHCKRLEHASRIDHRAELVVDGRERVVWRRGSPGVTARACHLRWFTLRYGGCKWGRFWILHEKWVVDGVGFVIAKQGTQRATSAAECWLVGMPWEAPRACAIEAALADANASAMGRIIAAHWDDKGHRTGGLRLVVRGWRSVGYV